MAGAVFFGWAAGSRAVDQSSTRNKRNDRLAEGHERVAGAVMVLRMDRAPSIPALATVYFGAPRRHPSCSRTVVTLRHDVITGGYVRKSRPAGKVPPGGDREFPAGGDVHPGRGTLRSQIAISSSRLSSRQDAIVYAGRDNPAESAMQWKARKLLDGAGMMPTPERTAFNSDEEEQGRDRRLPLRHQS
jgi:hypothetical protein